MSAVDPQGTPTRRGPLLGSLRLLFLVASFAGLVASNILSLVNAAAHDWMHSALWRVMSLAGHAAADKAMSKSPKAQLDDSVQRRTADLDAKNRRLVVDNELKAKELASVQVRNQELVKTMDAHGRQAKATVAEVHKRLAKGVSRSIAALPGEAVPYLGVGITVAVTAMDIYDACQTMKDFNRLLVMLGQGEENPELCGQKVPSKEEVIASAKAQWRQSMERVADEAKNVRVSIPEVRLPTGEELAKTSCAFVATSMLCKN